MNVDKVHSTDVKLDVDSSEDLLALQEALAKTEYLQKDPIETLALVSEAYRSGRQAQTH